jgi:hypothetical protein
MKNMTNGFNPVMCKPIMLTISEAAAFIGGLTKHRIRQMCLGGTLPHIKAGANEKTGKPLAPKTIRHYLSFISCVFTHAVDMRIMSESPCKSVKVPKNQETRKGNLFRYGVKDILN